MHNYKLCKSAARKRCCCCTQFNQLTRNKRKDIFMFNEEEVVLSNAADSSTVCSCCEQHAASKFIAAKHLRIAQAITTSFAVEIAEALKQREFDYEVAELADLISCSNKHEEDFIDETEVASYLHQFMQFAYEVRKGSEMLERESA